MMEKTGVLLINLGSASECTVASIRRFLCEFLSDQRVIELPKLLWRPLLYGLILRTRPRKLLAQYQAIWTPTGSPLHVITAHLALKLQAKLGEHYQVEYAMRYGKPSIQQALAKFKTLRKLIILPLYPHTSSTTTGSTFDKLYQELSRNRALPDLHFIHGYYNHPLYIQALAASVRRHWQMHARPQKLLFSYHGLPARNSRLGDAYESQCHVTSHALARALDLPEQAWMTVFQSRFGKQTWIKPYCVETLTTLAKNNITDVQILCPGFPSDCLETRYEIEIENKKIFFAAGGKQYHYIPALNDHEDHLQLLATLCEQ